MAISDKRLDDFIEIYEKVFEQRLSREEALPIATRLVTIYRLITQPLPPEATPPFESPPDQAVHEA